MTPRRVLEFTARFFYPVKSRETTGRIDECLDIAGLTHKSRERIQGFSGGELQRLGLAQAFINKPNLRRPWIPREDMMF